MPGTYKVLMFAFFCEKGCEEGELHQVYTSDADSNIRAMITELQDPRLIAQIEGGDLIAKDIKYHLKCLVNLRNQCRSLSRKSKKQQEDTNKKVNESRAFVELEDYIERAVDSGTLLFKLTELHSLYVIRLEDLGIKKVVNKTRLEISLLEHFPEAQEQNDGKITVIIIFREGMKNMLKEALKNRDYSEDGNILAKAAKIIRNDIFGHEGCKFNASFQPHCQEESLPSSLKFLISFILNGLTLKDQDRCDSQACFTTAQVVLYVLLQKMK